MPTPTYHILAINPGSTSTKIAFYENEQERFRDSLEHTYKELAEYPKVIDQRTMRKEAVLRFLHTYGVDERQLAAVVGRGGLLPPLQSGAYRVNDVMVTRLCTNPIAEHAANLGAVIAYDLALPFGIPAYIYDSVSVDELLPIARYSGSPELPRRSLIHALNMRAAAIKIAQKLGKPYRETTLLVAHLGGGISMSLHQHGKMIDIVSDDEGPFSPERTGRVPCIALAELCYSGKFTQRDMVKHLRGKGGLVAYLQTNKVVDVQMMIAQGREDVRLIFEAMAYQIAKGIGELATVVNGQVDRIVLTGGVAYSEMLTNWVKERVQFIAPVEILPGENELESLAFGVLRVLRGEEQAYEYHE
ncbi:MAG: butyrate kinase [Candidatus Vecturithrix sp.]|jgi:butyrate kinase|nr:butyrate kinase [Candidatus Vecturithrix sp.]